MNAAKLKNIKKNPMNRSFNESTVRMKIRAKYRYKKFFEDVSFKQLNPEEMEMN